MTFADNPELDAQVPATCAHRQAQGQLVDPDARGRGVQNLRLPRDRLHRRHSLPKSTGKSP